MNTFIHCLIYVYSRLLRLYPRRFRHEFAEEMEVVFRDAVNEALKNGILSLTLVWLRELGGLPFNILREFWHEFKRKETAMVTNEKGMAESVNDEKASHWVAFMSALPFALFGITSMIGKIRIPFLGVYANLVFCVIVLLGLLIGLIKGFPRWAYSYLGWTLLFAWWWTNMSTDELRIFGYTMHNEAWGWRIWYPLFTTIGLALLWVRSIRPMRQLVRGIWEDWTLLSLAIYAFIGFLMLLYDENRAPYVTVFMTASTLAVSASVWIFMRSTKTQNRVIALLSGFVAGLIIERICESTWDFAAYYGLPPQPSLPWYDSVLQYIIIVGFGSLILLWPALVGLVRRATATEP